MKSFISYLNETDLSNWKNFTEMGSVDGVPHGFGGQVKLFNATNINTDKQSWFLKHPRLGHMRMISADHVLVRKLKHGDKVK